MAMSPVRGRIVLQHSQNAQIILKPLNARHRVATVIDPPEAETATGVRVDVRAKTWGRSKRTSHPDLFRLSTQIQRDQAVFVADEHPAVRQHRHSPGQLLFVENLAPAHLGVFVRGCLGEYQVAVIA
jgi:hypothetical protein